MPPQLQLKAPPHPQSWKETLSVYFTKQTEKSIK